MKIILLNDEHYAIKEPTTDPCREVCDWRQCCENTDCGKSNQALKEAGDAWIPYRLKWISPIEVFCRKKGIWRKYKKNWLIKRYVGDPNKKWIDNGGMKSWLSSIGNRGIKHMIDWCTRTKGPMWELSAEGYEFWERMDGQFQEMLKNNKRYR